MPLRLKDTLKPDVDGKFAIIDAADVSYQADERQGRLSEFMFKVVTQTQYNTLKADRKLNPNTPYLIVEDDDA